MTESYRFVDGISYTEAQYMEYMKRLISKDGVVTNESLETSNNKLQVTAATPAAMSVLLKSGECFVQAEFYQNTADKTLAIAASDASWNRYDRIVVGIDWSANTCGPYILTGIPAASPIIPSLTQTAAKWEIPLYTLLVTAGVTDISGNYSTLLTDERYWAACNLGPFRVDSSGNLQGDGTKRITNVADPSGNQDVATKKYTDDKIDAAIVATAVPNIYGSGADGAIHLTADTGGYSGLKQCTTFLLDAGKTLTLTGDMVIIAKISITINGNIVGTGAGNLLGGVGATVSGSGTANPTNPSGFALMNVGVPGPVNGLGTVINTHYPNLGIALTAARIATFGGVHEFIQLLLTGICGAGCGAGGSVASNNASAVVTGGNGGKEGACLVLIAPSITIAGTSTITLSGAPGGAASSLSYSNEYGYGGGGGNGGILLLAAKSITNSGSFVSNGGAAGAGTQNGSEAPAYNGNAGTAGSLISAEIL